jgi:hypothetical protein
VHAVNTNQQDMADSAFVETISRVRLRQDKPAEQRYACY